MLNRRFVVSSSLLIAWALAPMVQAGVSNGDWKSGDFTDWNVNTSQNPAQERGVASFSFAPLEGPPAEAPCGAQGGMGNCAAFFGAGAQMGMGTGASIFLSQDGSPPPLGTGVLVLNAGTPVQLSAQIAAQNRSAANPFDGGRIIVRARPSFEIIPGTGTVIAQHVFGQLGPGQTSPTVSLAGTFLPMVSGPHILEFEFHRTGPHIPGLTPVNWIDNITFDGDCPCNPDANGDGLVNILDVNQTQQCVGQPPQGPCQRADVDCSGVIDFADVQAVICRLNGGTPQECCNPSPLVECCLSDGCAPFLPEDVCGAQGGVVIQGCDNCVPAGPDCWNTPCDGTHFDFCTQPIPADFFAPGSLPFDGIVRLGGGLDEMDTVVQRNSLMAFGNKLPNAAQVPIELIQLNLFSCQPITVQPGNQLWSVQVTRSTNGGDIPHGILSATKEHSNGGTFNAMFPVLPTFTFTSISNPGLVRVLDFGLEGIPPVDFQTVGASPWVHNLSPSIPHIPCGINFVPGVAENPESLEQCCMQTCHAGPGPGHQHCTNQCTVCPRGACCNLPGGGCTIAEGAVACAGEYKGDGTNCDDSDGDGIVDVNETNDCCQPGHNTCNTGTHPLFSDTDGDGIDDGAELAMGCDPCVAGDCVATHDHFVTRPTSPVGPTRLQIGTPAIPAMPAGFFGPGSDPFTGLIDLDGDPIDAPNLGETSAIVGRLGEPFSPLDPIGTTGMVPIELVALNLVSVMPITVTFNGGQNPQPWDVRVQLSQLPQPQGSLSAHKDHPNGGTFSTVLRVLPSLVFTRPGVPGSVVFDMGLQGLPPILFQSNNVPFVHLLDSSVGVLVNDGQQFVPGVRETVPGDPTSQTTVPFTEGAPSVFHTVEPTPGKRCIYRLDCIDGDCENCMLHNPGLLCQKSYCTPTGGTCADLNPTTCGGPDCCIDLNLIDCRFPNGEPICPDFEQSCPCDPTPGACCFDKDGSTCSILTESRCVAAGGSYQGDGTECGPVGACCFADGACREVNEICCDDLGGMFEGGECDPRQRCCLPDGGCENLDPECCQLIGGTPLDGQCEPDQACCVGANCLDTDPVCCEIYGGNAQGGGTACTAPQGCCLLLGGCVDADPLCCEDMLGTPQGAGTSCTAPGGCCFDNGSCLNLDPLCCEELDGTFTGGTCDAPRECCLPDGSCVDTDPQCCIEIYNGTPGVGLCQTPQRCCMPDGSCLNLDPDCCENIGGMAGDGTCEPARKCCLDDGTCRDTDPFCCVNRFGGLPGIGPAGCGPLLECCLPGTGECRDVDNTCCALSLGGNAGDFPCTGITQECCLDGGECRDLEGQCCIDIGGAPGLSDCDPIQACCFLGTHTCDDLEPNCCVGEGGIPQGLSACTVADACCLPNGTCVMIDPICCDDLGGVWEGFGSACTAPQGCCLPNGTCIIADPLCCEDQGGEPQGPGSICTAPQACCLPNGTCQSLDRLCCIERGGEPQGAETACTAIRACCFDGGACLDLDPLCCDDQGGTPLAPGTMCESAEDGGGNPCQPPTQACCQLSGTCSDVPDSDCVLGGGTPQGAGTSCSDPGICHRPFIVHATGQPGQTRPCTGYIDPRAESSNGIAINQGLDIMTLVFNEPVFSISGAPVTPASFIVSESTPALPPAVMSVDVSANPLIVIRLNRFITLRAWTTVRAVVRNAAGVRIDNQGDLGPGMPEPDRIDLAALPADVNQTGNVSPLDLLRFKQYVNGLAVPACGVLLDYVDMNRSGGLSPLDLLRFKQAINNINPPSTQSWNGVMLTGPQP